MWPALHFFILLLMFGSPTAQPTPESPVCTCDGGTAATDDCEGGDHCVSCDAGYGYYEFYGQCYPCNDYSYNSLNTFSSSDTNTGGCADMLVCGPGEYESKAGTATSDRECAQTTANPTPYPTALPTPPPTPSPSSSPTPVCTCDGGTAATGDDCDGDYHCVSCDAGYGYNGMWWDCYACNSELNKFSSSDTNRGGCYDMRVCVTGEYESQAGTASSDRECTQTTDNPTPYPTALPTPPPTPSPSSSPSAFPTAQPTYKPPESITFSHCTIIT